MFYSSFNLTNISDSTFHCFSYKNINFRSPILPRLLFILAAVLISNHQEASAVSFGQNNVQYTYFQWKYLTTEHFDVYYNQGGREIADFAAEIAEEAYRDIARTFLYSTEGDQPIMMITYQSHNDFEQTNVTNQPSESTGGVTEFLKTRIVVPFEGDHEKFRHVIHHELTHAMMMNMLYGQGFSAIVAGISQSRVPLWFIEGLAEYKSNGGLDSETEMFLRDAVVNDILPEVRQLDAYGYLGVYKCGQSILYWIAWRYGDEKIGEILNQIKTLGEFSRALKASIGLDMEELSERWRRFIKERYWPQIGEMDPPGTFSRQITDHIKDYCYVNNSPSLSPNGEWLAFLSNRSDYFDIYLMNTMDGKVVKRLLRGQRSGKFEELHWLQPGITWSPDGDYVAFTAKAGEHDALYIITVPEGKISKIISYKSDGLFSPSWSPDGKDIALVLVQEGQSDIIVVDTDTEVMRRITDDIYDDADPAWSNDAENILFVSNRSIDFKNSEEKIRVIAHDFDYQQYDIFKISLNSKTISQITDDKFHERTPISKPAENTIVYVSNRTGIYNIYTLNLDNNKSQALSNVVSGTFQPTIARRAGTLAFTSYFNNGYDIFTMSDPFNDAHNKDVTKLPEAEKIASKDVNKASARLSSLNYKNFVFDRLYRDNEEEEKREEDSLDVVSRAKMVDGKYPSKDYSVGLQPDMVFVNASYGPYYLLQGSGFIMFSDILGNHQLFVSADLNRSTRYSNFFFMYNYLPRRVDIGWGVYHFAYPFYDRNIIWLDRNYGIFGTASYPLNRFDRIEFGLDFSTIDRSEYTTGDSAGTVISTLLPHIGYVHDTSVWRWSTGPANGGRWRIDFNMSPNLGSGSRKGVDFRTLSMDWRRYYAYHKDYTFGIRFSGALSGGRNPQRFFMGGMDNWFNSRFDNREGRVIINMNDIYFSRFVTPLRGVGYYNQIGTRYMLFNSEFRFPFIRYLLFGWPLPAFFRDVRGAFFTDIGGAWYTRGQINSSSGSRQNKFNLNEWSGGFGFGIRMNLGLFPIEWDVAWSPESNMRPQYYFSLNYGF